MIFKQLGNTGIKLSAIGLGTYAIGGGDYKYGWGPQDDKDSVATIRRALELGVNWIDVAPLYGYGRAEQIVGQSIKGLKKDVIISTKCGLFMDANNEEFTYNLKEESIRGEVEASLKRLNIDVIDLYQLHRPFPEEQLEEGWHTLASLKREGKIRFAGVSAFSLLQIQKVHAIHPVAFLQPYYNMIGRTIEDDGILDYCAVNNIGVISYSSMATGLLTGKFSKEKMENLPKDDLRRVIEPFQEPFLSANLQLVERLRPIAQRNCKTVAHLAIAWVLRRPEVTSAIVGARLPSQIEETVVAGDWILTAEELEELDNILDEHRVCIERLKGENEDK